MCDKCKYICYDSLFNNGYCICTRSTHYRTLTIDDTGCCINSCINFSEKDK